MINVSGMAIVASGIVAHPHTPSERSCSSYFSAEIRVPERNAEHAHHDRDYRPEHQE